MNHRPTLRVIAFVCIAASLWMSGCKPSAVNEADVYRTEVSPDQRFKLVVYRTPRFVAFPGQSSDAPGQVRLYDLKTGTVLQQKSVEMVQLIDQIEWSDRQLHIKLFADWPLPE